MKKIIGIMLILLLCLGLAACGADGDASSTKDSASAATKDSAAVSSDAEKDPDAPKGAEESDQTYASLEDYLNDPRIQDSIDAQKENADSAMKFDVYAQDDTLVYEYTYASHIEEDSLSSVKDNLENALQQNESSFDAVVDELKKHIDMDNPKVKIIYRNDDGEEITEKVFE